MPERANAVYLVTGINEPYLTRAEPYLASMNHNSSVNNVVITLDFEIPRKYRDSHPALRFLPLSSNRVKSPNPNSCLQHGGFLPALDFVRDRDVLIYTDADIEMQRPFNQTELDLLSRFDDDEIGVGYNKSEDQSLLEEAAVLNPALPVSDLAARYPGISAWATYNTGVLVANAKTYQKLYALYDQHWQDLAPLLAHYAKQQWLLSYLIHKHFQPRLLPSTLHTHGHHPVALRVNEEAGYKFCVGSEIVLLSHALHRETERLEKRIRILQRHVRKWAAVAGGLALLCIFLAWRWWGG